MPLTEITRLSSTIDFIVIRKNTCSINEARLILIFFNRARIYLLIFEIITIVLIIYTLMV